MDPEPLKEMEPEPEPLVEKKVEPIPEPEPAKVDVEPVIIPLVQGFPMPDEEEEAVVQLSLQVPITQDAKEDEEPCFEWNDGTTMGKNFPAFEQGRIALKIVDEEFVFFNF